MAIELGVAGFFEFITRPFTSVAGWIFLIGIAIYIWARVTGKINFKKDQQKGGGSSNYGGTTRPDYKIK